MLVASDRVNVLSTVILIVEDDLFIREMAEMTIQGLGHHTLLASDIGEALLVIRSPQEIDVLFTDIYLKTEIHGGCNVARQARELRPKLPVLYATGNALTEKVRAMLVEGAVCLQKPYTPDQLTQSLAGLLAA